MNGFHRYFYRTFLEETFNIGLIIFFNTIAIDNVAIDLERLPFLYRIQMERE